MRALYVFIATAGLTISSAASATCPLPTKTGSTTHRDLGGHHWGHNTDGWTHLVVTDSSIDSARLRAISKTRIPCSVMDQVLKHASMNVVSVGWLGRAIEAGLELPSIETKGMDVYDADFNPGLWRHQADVVQQSTAPAGVAKFLAYMQTSFFFDPQWNMWLVQDNAAARGVFRYSYRRAVKSWDLSTVTFTGDFRNPTWQTAEAFDQQFFARHRLVAKN